MTFGRTDVKNERTRMFQVAYIGGGSLFLPSIVNGLAHEAKTLRDAGAEVAFDLYDIAPERAERMARYAAIAAGGLAIPLRARVAPSLAEAMEGARLVFLSISHPGLEEGWKALHEQFPVEPHGEGPARVAYEGSRVFEACVPIGEEMAKRAAPGAVFATLVNPTDVIAGAFERRFGIRSIGMCCEVGGLIGMLAHHLGYRFEDFALNHVGVNHDGWVLGLRIQGEDRYGFVRERLPQIARQGCVAQPPSAVPAQAEAPVPHGSPGFHPVSLMMLPVLRLTGHLRSSAYHRWPIVAGESIDWGAALKPWPRKRDRHEAALEQALRAGQPIPDDEPVHPELSAFQYREFGRHIGQTMAAMAAGVPRVVPLQVRNAGASAQFPAEAVLEVPTLVAGTRIQPLAVGPAPDWLIPATRSFALSRALASQYLADPKLETLLHSLAVFPMFGVAENLLGFAEALHRGFALEKSDPPAIIQGG